MKFNQETDYAIRMASVCAEYSTERLSGNYIIDVCNIPERWGKIILTKLCNNKILKSTKGKHGGFEINAPLESLSLWDIITIFEPVEVNLCSDKEFFCNNLEEESALGKLTILQDSIESQLKQILIKDLV